RKKEFPELPNTARPQHVARRGRKRAERARRRARLVLLRVEVDSQHGDAFTDRVAAVCYIRLRRKPASSWRGCEMRRAEFGGLLGGAAAWPLAARGQQAGKVWRIGFLGAGVRPTQLGSSVQGGFLRGMRELGYVEGRDFVMEWRFAETRPEL